MKQKFTILIFILLIIFSVPLYSISNNNSEIKLAVIGFKNTKELRSYDYLSSSLQNSIYSSLSRTNEIGLIRNDVSNDKSDKYNLGFESLEDMSKVLRFAIDTRATVVLSGEYIINEEDNRVTIRVFAFSIAEKKIVYANEFIGNMGTGIFDLIDRISIETAQGIIEQKDVYEKFIREMLNDNVPPKYINQPYVNGSNSKGVIVEWETDKDTVASLYVGVEDNFRRKDSIFTVNDISEDGQKHLALIKYSDIIKNDIYYFRAYDKDFNGNEISSDIHSISIKEIKEILNDTRIALSKELYHNIENNLFSEAYKISSNLIDMIDKYSEFLDTSNINIDELKRINTQLKEALEIEETLNNAYKLLEEGHFDEALVNFQIVKKFIEVHQINDIITIKYINSTIYRIEKAIIAKDLILEGDNLSEGSEYKLARKKYQQALFIIENEDIDDLIPILNVESRLKNLPVTLGTSFYINFSLGGGYAHMGENGGIYNNISPGWELALTYRLDRVFSFGLGVNLYFIETFGKVSFLNTLSIDTISSELFFKPTFYINFLFDLSLAGGGSIGYILGFGESVGLYFDIEFIYDFYLPALFMLGKVGFVLYF